MSDDTSIAADLSEAMGGSYTPSTDAGTTTAATPDPTSAATEGTATTVPAPVPSSVQGQQKQGPIPFDVHHTALENARTKAVEEYRQQHGWAEKVNPQDFQRAVSLAQRLADPSRAIDGLQEIIADLRQNPEMDAALRSFQGRALAQLRQHQSQGPHQAAPVDLNPINVQFDNGHTAGMYNSDQVKALITQAMDQLQQQVMPIRQAHEQLQQREAAAERSATANKHADSIFADVKALPGVDDAAMDKMAAALANDPLLPNDGRPKPLEAVHLAALRAYNRVVLPNLSAASRQAAMSDIHQKAQTNTVSPNRPQTGSPQRDADRSYQDLFRSELAARGRR